MTRICPERDAVCPHGDNCPYALDRYRCRSEEEPAASVSEQKPMALERENARLREALEWYGDNASATKRHLEGRVNDNAILAIITTLALDGGKRARAALDEKGGEADG